MRPAPIALHAMLCPICKRPVSDDARQATAPATFPFCSERCKLIDLGRWLDGKYQIPVSDLDPEESPPQINDE